MPNILKLVPFSNKQTVAALRVLLQRAERGEISGVALCFMEREGREFPILTGTYAARPEIGAKATLALSIAIATNTGELRGSP